MMLLNYKLTIKMILKTALSLISAVVVGMSSLVYAVPIDSNVSISGSVSFDDTASLIDGGATQTGAFGSVLAGSSAAHSSTLSGTTVTGGNSHGGSLSDIGDGVFANYNLNGSSQGSESGLTTDFRFDLENTSLTDSFRVTFEVDIDNNADADGTDAFIHSQFSLFDSSSADIFFSDLLSDTSLGDEFNGGFPPTSGGALVDTRTFTFSFDLNPGDNIFFDGFIDMTAGAFDSSTSYSGQLDSSINLMRVENLSSTNPVPLPSTLLLLVVGLLTMRFGFIAKMK